MNSPSKEKALKVAAPGSLLHELEQLAPALAGFPVGQLLDVFVSTDRDRASAYQLIGSCLESWITALEGALDSYPEQPDDSLLRIQSRQRGARDALARVQSALASADVVHENRGQLC